MKQTIKILTVFFSLFFCVESARAQVPQLFNYQGIARDAKGNPLSNQKMAIKLAVLPTADATVSEYEETQIISTNEFGLYTLQIGNGTAVNGEMKTVKWETGNKYIRVAIDPTGGTNYVDAGTNQLLSVPYAIYADKAGVAASGGNDKTRAGMVNSEAAHVAGDAGYLTRFTALNTIGKSTLYQGPTGTIGIGTTAPTALAKFHIKQESPAGGNLEYLRMQNLDPNGFGKFIMYNDAGGNYATFTKYGSTYPGGYPGPNVAGQFPYANLLAFGNNTGPFLLSNNGNVGIGIVSAGSTVLKFNVTHPSGNVGIGGSATPAAAIHFNNNAASETLLLTNNTTGHTNADGLEIRNTGNTAWITNKENSNLSLSTNSANPNTVTITPNQLLYNATSTPTISDVIYFQPKNNGGSNWMSIQGTKTGSYTFLNMIDSGSGNKGTIFGQSSSLYGGSDSAGFIIYNPTTHSTAVGTYAAGGLILNNSNGKMGNGYWFSGMTGNAQLNITSNSDTAGYFTSSSSNSLNNGILRAQYTGANVTADHVAVFGRSDIANGWGIGVRGHGGWLGVNASTIGGLAGIYATATNGSGVYGFSSEGTGVNAVSYSTNGGNNSLYADASFSKARAVRAVADSNQAGLFTSGNAAYSDALFGGVLRGEYTGAYVTDAIGVYGYSKPNPADYYGIGVRGEGGYYGVSGIANSTTGFKYGTHGSASGGGSINYGVYGSASGASTNYAGYFAGTLYATTVTGGTKPFTIDHPLDPQNKFLRHSSIESPDMMNVYNGNITTDANGFATVTLPDYFEALNEDFKYQLTVIGTFASAIIKEEIASNQFVIQTNQPNIKVSWQVTGIRHDAVANKYRIVVEQEKPEGQKGLYLEPEAFGQPREMGANYPESQKKENIALSKVTDYKADHARVSEETKAGQLEIQRRAELENQANKNWKPQVAPKSNGVSPGGSNK